MVSAKQKIRQENDGNASVQGALAVSDGAGTGKRLADRSVRIRNQNRKRKAARTERKADRIEIKARYQEALQKDATFQDLLTAVTDEFEVPEEEASKDIEEFLEQLEKYGFLEKRTGGEL